MLNDEQVARLLLGDTSRPWLDPEGGPAAVAESADDGDALEAMRGLLVGSAWAVAVWGLIATTFVLAWARIVI